MTVKGTLQRPPTVRIGGGSIRLVSAATVLGMVLDEHLPFAQHAQTIGERASKSFGKVSRVLTASWGMSALLRRQRPSLVLLTKAYRTVSTPALPVLAGVLPAHYEVTITDRTDRQRDGLTRAEVRVFKRRAKEEAVIEWQKEWDEETKGRELYRFFPEVSARLSFDWIEPDYETSQLLTGHRCFRKRLYDMDSLST
ncbi:Retrovirus-related Pol polyprotein from type-1 retrotransposable element R1 4 [Eumeta japonica]|uniref:Retrovirus-related Pol polyprotein from type-1 retrotransposable element R1 4 n=1 Tax=Eumeta variegata TaxID=151549 RepID=A0A4C1XSA8_EUMVA|nr:Retrovirus-related Pol polyprotein from type-1 retrotransposable element R1 4 [Eumeta japonica]